MESNKKHILQVIFQIIVILVIGSGSIWIASLFSKEKNITIPRVVCPLDTKSYEATKINKNLILLENKSSYGKNGSFDGHSYTVSLNRTGLNSQVACGYLFYRINVEDKPIDKEYEGLYMIPTDSRQFGGHILPDEKSAIGINEVATSTEFLIPLNEIPYDGTTRINIKQADWVSLLNVANQMSFDIALNTISPAGHIDSVEIAYKCWNPQTGQETEDCKLELVQ